MYAYTRVYHTHTQNVYIYTNTDVYTYACTFIYTYTIDKNMYQHIYTHMHSHTYTHIHTHKKFGRFQKIIKFEIRFCHNHINLIVKETYVETLSY